MKRLLIIIAISVTIGVSAQVPSEPFQTASTAPGNVALTNQFRLFGTNYLPADLGPMLTQLQGDLEQLLPAVATFNNKFDFAAILEQLRGNPLPGTGTDLSTNVSSDISGNLATSLATDLSTTIATPTASTPPPILGATPGTIPPTATGVTNAYGLPPGFVATVPTNFPVIIAAARDSLRKLVLLQGEMERMLPLVAALNGADVIVSPVSNGSANVAPLPVNPTPPPAQFQPPILSPTGR